MIENKDRVPVNANRKYIVPEGGATPYYATVTYADGASITGTPINKLKLDEMLSANGTTTGTSSALLLAQVGFVLVDGATIRFKLHVAPTTTVTVNVNGTGAKSLINTSGENILGLQAGAWIQAVYNSSTSKWLTESAGISSLKFTNTSVLTTAFVADTTYPMYAYRASITLSGVISTMIATVIFAPTEAISGMFAPVTNTYTGGVYIYANAKPASTITIPTILCEK